MPFIDLSSPAQQNQDTNESKLKTDLPSLNELQNVDEPTPITFSTDEKLQDASQVKASSKIASENEKDKQLEPLDTKGFIEIKGPPLLSSNKNNNQSQLLEKNIEKKQMTSGNMLSSDELQKAASTIESVLGGQDTKQNGTVPKNSIAGVTKLPPLESILGVQSDTKNSNEGQAQTKQKTPSLQKVGVEELDPGTLVKQNVIQTQTNKKGVGVSSDILTNFDALSANMEDFMSYTIASKASDLHISSDYPVYIRVDGDLKVISNSIVKNDRVEKLFYEIINERQRNILKQEKELDFSYTHSSQDRFRVNLFYKQGNLSGAFRLIPRNIRSIAELKLPDILYELTKLPHGLILVTGPTGSGKSTTIASMLQEINVNRAEHIITIEDPIEYVYPRMKSLIEQREIGYDTLSWNKALRSILRQDPNIVLVGEMRDYETIQSTVTVAETGHLVFATLHTNSASETIDRIIDVFPEGQQPQIRAQLANVISAVISQRLIPIKSGGRKAILEILIATPAIKNSIREGKTYQINNIIQTSSDIGMHTLEASLVECIKEGEITIEEAQNYTVKYDELMSLLKVN